MKYYIEIDGRDIDRFRIDSPCIGSHGNRVLILTDKTNSTIGFELKLCDDRSKGMTLKEFCDMWTRKNVPIILCPYKLYDDMFDLVDDINEGKKGPEDISEYSYGAIIPYFSSYCDTFILDEKFATSEVMEFYSGKDISIVWLRRSEDERD